MAVHRFLLAVIGPVGVMTGYRGLSAVVKEWRKKGGRPSYLHIFMTLSLWLSGPRLRRSSVGADQTGRLGIALSTVNGAIQRGAEFTERERLKSTTIINVKK
jgi:hypothetical protein